MPLYRVDVAASDVWTYDVRANTEEEAEKAAISKFKNTGGSGLYYYVENAYEIEDSEDEKPDIDLT